MRSGTVPGSRAAGELREVRRALLREGVCGLLRLLGHVEEQRGVAGELLQAGLAVGVGVERGLQAAQRDRRLLRASRGTTARVSSSSSSSGTTVLTSPMSSACCGVVLAAEEPDLARLLLADDARQVARRRSRRRSCRPAGRSGRSGRCRRRSSDRRRRAARGRRRSRSRPPSRRPAWAGGGSAPAGRAR